jgi:hypothetical protein
VSTVLAHGGAHWAESLIYLVPVILVVVWLVVSWRIAAREQPRATDEPPRPSRHHPN